MLAPLYEFVVFGRLGNLLRCISQGEVGVSVPEPCLDAVLHHTIVEASSTFGGYFAEIKAG